MGGDSPQGPTLQKPRKMDEKIKEENVHTGFRPFLSGLRTFRRPVTCLITVEAFLGGAFRPGLRTLGRPVTRLIAIVALLGTSELKYHIAQQKVLQETIETEFGGILIG